MLDKAHNTADPERAARASIENKLDTLVKDGKMTRERADEILALCQSHAWQVIVGLEPDQPEDLSDVRKLMHSLAIRAATAGRWG